MQEKYKLIEFILKSDLTDVEKQSLIAELNNNNNNKKRVLDEMLKIFSTVKALEFILSLFKN